MIVINISNKPAVADGTKPALHMYDELDALVWMYGREGALKLFEQAKG